MAVDTQKLMFELQPSSHVLGQPIDRSNFFLMEKMEFGQTRQMEALLYDLRKGKEIFSKCQLGGSSVMIWRCFAYSDESSVVFVLSKMNSQSYQCVLESHLLLNAEFVAGENR